MHTRSEFPPFQSMTLLSRLLLVPHDAEDISWMSEELHRDLTRLSREEFDDLVHLAQLNHVVMRGFEVFRSMMQSMGDDLRVQWAVEALDAERRRIDNAIPRLAQIVQAFEDAGLNCCVIKSLDHWPDLGSDLDLYTDARPEQVIRVMTSQFNATIDSRSWGDRLACKWNFEVPGLPELVEIHVGRLGQTGEQVAIATSLLKRSRTVSVAGHSFRVVHKSDRILISTLQRMYRHFYFRLCDIVDSAALVERDGIDFADLQAAARRAGIWEGTATYLIIVSDYVARYRGTAIHLPKSVTTAARFGGETVYYGRGFLRVPLMPQSARLYGTQLAETLRKRELNNGARLSLLPWLATAAVVGQKVTGSDKGIW